MLHLVRKHAKLGYFDNLVLLSIVLTMISFSYKIAYLETVRVLMLQGFQILDTFCLAMTYTMVTLYQLMVLLTLDFVHQSSLLNTTVIPPLTIAIVLLMAYRYCLVLTVVASVLTQMSFMEHIHTTGNYKPPPCLTKKWSLCRKTNLPNLV